MVFKKGEKRSTGKGDKRTSQEPGKSTQKTPGRKPHSKNRAETYSVYIYRVLK